MKIAVIGGGPLAIEMATMMHRLEAEVVLYSPSKLGGAVLNHFSFSSFSMEASWSDLTTAHGREISGIGESDKIPSLKEYYRQYLCRLIDFCQENISIKPYRVDRVQKRFLHKREEIPGKGRLNDLFRVIHIRESDSGSLEFFDDYDIVIEALGTDLPVLLGPAGGPSINENLLADMIHYDITTPIVEELLDFDGTVTIVGEGATAASMLLFLKSWLGLNHDNNIYLIQESTGTFENLEMEFPLLDKEVTAFIQEEKVYWQKSCRKVEEEIENYRVLDREEQIKFRMPEFPEPRLKILTGYTATSVDQLTDREGLFLTLECPEWKREGEREIFTINTGKLFVLRGNKGHFLGQEMRLEQGPIHSEQGYYTPGQNLLMDKGYYQLQEVLPCLFAIKDNIMDFFTKVESS